MDNSRTWPRSAADAGAGWQPLYTEADDGLAAMHAFVQRRQWGITQQYAQECVDFVRKLDRVRRKKVVELLRDALDLLDADNDEGDKQDDGAVC